MRASAECQHVLLVPQMESHEGPPGLQFPNQFFGQCPDVRCKAKGVECGFTPQPLEGEGQVIVGERVVRLGNADDLRESE